MKKIKVYASNQNFMGDEIKTDMDVPIFGMRSLGLFETQLGSKKTTNSLTNPQNWFKNLNGDKYENIFLKSEYKIPTQPKPINFNFADDFYCQCWSSNENSDAMWQIYSCERNELHNEQDELIFERITVQIKTTPKKLIDSLVKSFKDEGNDRAYIGYVNYIHENKFQSIADEVAEYLAKPPYSTKAFMSTLYNKKKSYEHEKEIRLSYCSIKNDKILINGDDKYYEYEIDYSDLIDEVIIDPRLTHKEFDFVKNKLIDLGITDDKISKSNAYEELHLLGIAT